MRKKIVKLLLLSLIITTIPINTQAKGIHYDISERTLICEDNNAKIYSTAELDEVIETIDVSTLMTKVEELEDCYLVQTPSGTMGYIKKKNVVDSDEVDTYISDNISDFTVMATNNDSKIAYEDEIDLLNSDVDKHTIVWSDLYKLHTYSRILYTFYNNINEPSEQKIVYEKVKNPFVDGKEYTFKSFNEAFLVINIHNKYYFVLKDELKELKEEIKSREITLDAGNIFNCTDYTDKGFVELERTTDNDETYYIYTTPDDISYTINTQKSDAIFGVTEEQYKQIYVHEPIKGYSSTRNKIVNEAIKHLGGIYTWGGTNYATGVDCSAFMMNVYKSNGLNIGRTTRDQQVDGVGKFIAPSEIQYGDLIYYTKNGVTPHHVVMYIGDGKCIEAKGRAYGIVIDDVDWYRVLSIKDYADELVKDEELSCKISTNFNVDLD